MPIKTMYPGVANSPETTLSQPLNNTATTMYLVDGDVLGQLPTYATIGDNATAETVLVTTKAQDGGFTIQRGVEGTAKAWVKDTVVARNFANKDYQTLVDNVKTLDAEKVDKVTISQAQTAQAEKDKEQDVAIAERLKATDAANTYATKDSVSKSFQAQATKDQAQDTAIAERLKTADAAATYETQTHAANTYETKSDAAATYAATNSEIEKRALKTEIPKVVNDLTTGGTNAALSAEQGKVMNANVNQHANDFNAWKAPWTQQRAEQLDLITDILNGGGGVTKGDLMMAATGYLLEAFFLQTANFATDANAAFGSNIPSTYQSFKALVANTTDFTESMKNARFAAAVVNSINALDAIALAGKAAINALLSSPVAINEITTNVEGLMRMLENEYFVKTYTASSTAMTAIAASSTAMTAIINNSNALNTVVNSSTAMTAIASNTTAFNQMTNNATAYSRMIVSAKALKGIYTAHKQKGVSVVFCRKFNAGKHTADAIPGETIGTAWLNQSSPSSNTNRLHTNSMPNDVMIVQSSGEGLSYDAVEFDEGGGCGEYGTGDTENSADGKRIMCKLANQIIFTYSAQKCFIHGDGSNSAPQKLSYVKWN